MNGHNSPSCNIDMFTEYEGDLSHPNVDLGVLTVLPSMEHSLDESLLDVDASSSSGELVASGG